MDSDRVSPAPPYSGYPSSITGFAYGTFTPFGRFFQTVLLTIDRIVQVLQPQDVNTLVWALPRSLATTYGIIVIFFSSAYLDVSVQRVVDFCLTVFNRAGFPIRTSTDVTVVCTSP